MNKIKLALSAALIISISANIYLFMLVVDWQEAWTEQILTTSVIEKLYSKSGADVTFNSVKNLVEKELGEYEIVPAADNLWVSSDEDAILVYGTQLYFKNGIYIGSKAKLPSHLVHWRFGQEEF